MASVAALHPGVPETLGPSAVSRNSPTDQGQKFLVFSSSQPALPLLHNALCHVSPATLGEHFTSLLVLLLVSPATLPSPSALSSLLLSPSYLHVTSLTHSTSDKKKKQKKARPGLLSDLMLKHQRATQEDVSQATWKASPVSAYIARAGG